MSIVTLPSYGSDPATVNAANLDGKVDPLATDYNGNIQNVNIASDAAIANYKLNLSSITQNITHSGTMTHSSTVTMTAKDITEAKGADVASATTTECYVADGNFIHITGTTTITSLGTAAQAGDSRTLVFDDALTLTHNATSLILPTGANITTAAGDVAIIRAETTANTRVVAYLRKDGTALAATTVTPAFENALLHVREEQTANTAGGTFTSGSWQTRTLNTSKTNEISGASLGSNQITLPAGTYFIEAYVPAFTVDTNKAKLYNITDTADEIVGTSTNSSASGEGHESSMIFGRFTIAAQKVFEIQHQCLTTKATNGFGKPSNFGVVEVYTEVMIWKVA